MVGPRVYLVLRLLNSDDRRWWIAIGAVIGLGLMTRYTIAGLVVGLAIGFLLTPARSYLMSRWLIAGAVLTLVIVAPNLIWQANHGFISLDFLRTVHARDIQLGRTNGFLWKQLLVPAHVLTIPLWIAGLSFYFRKPEGVRYRVLGWTFVAVLVLFAIISARDYYTAPLYPMLLAAGAVLSDDWPRWARGLTWAGLAVALGSGIALVLPVAPINSRWFEASNRVSDNLREEIGWQELVDTVATIRDSLPIEERATTGILTGNYGEAGAINLYGPAHGLPMALSRANSTSCTPSMCSWTQLAHLPWARGSSFQLLYSVSFFFSLSNNLGNLLFARQSTRVASIDGVMGQFWLSQRAGGPPCRPCKTL